jgi:hypothetical protein
VKGAWKPWVPLFAGSLTIHTVNDDKGVINVDLFDVEAKERAEGEIDRFILKPERDRSEANRVEALWKASDRRHHARLREQRRWEWVRHFEHIRDLCAQGLADEHRVKAEALLEGAAS